MAIKFDKILGKIREEDAQDLSAYVENAGDTMTGTLTMRDAGITLDTASASETQPIKLQPTGWAAKTIYNRNSTLVFGQSSGTTQRMFSMTYAGASGSMYSHGSAAEFFPADTGSTRLGRTGNRWDNIYAQNVNSETFTINDSGGLGTPTPGTLEFDNDRIYLTNVGTARAIDRTSDVITSTATVANTVTETTIYTGTIGANDLKAGNLLKVRVNGVISNATAADDITISVYIGSTQVSTFNPAIGNVTNAIWSANFELTVRSVGASGSIAFHGKTEINGNAQENTSIETINTTIAENLTIKVQWDNAKAGNTISAYQGYLEFKN